MRAVVSPAARARRFAVARGIYLTELMSLSWPAKVWVHLPVRMSHTLAIVSQPPETKMLGCVGQIARLESGGPERGAYGRPRERAGRRRRPAPAAPPRARTS